MRNALFIFSVSSFLMGTGQAQTLVFSNNFGSGFNNGNLVGQGGWAQTSTASNNPIQVTAGQVVLPASLGGQDVWAPFSAIVSNTPGQYMLTTLSISVTNATAAGDYFFHVSNTTNTTSGFFQRLYARTNSTGQLNFGLTLSTTNAVAPTFNWGATAFALNTTYNAVMKWDFIAGALNDSMSLFINPSGSIETWTPEISLTWNASTTAEPVSLAAINFRQGGPTTTPGVLVNSLGVQVIPEPSSQLLMMLGMAGLVGLRAARRRQRS